MDKETLQKAKWNGESSAAPIIDAHEHNGGSYTIYKGFSKRETLAAMMLQGILANLYQSHDSSKSIEEAAVNHADKLLIALAENK